MTDNVRDPALSRGPVSAFRWRVKSAGKKSKAVARLFLIISEGLRKGSGRTDRIRIGLCPGPKRTQFLQRSFTRWRRGLELASPLTGSESSTKSILSAWFSVTVFFSYTTKKPGIPSQQTPLRRLQQCFCGPAFAISPEKNPGPLCRHPQSAGQGNERPPGFCARKKGRMRPSSRAFQQKARKKGIPRVGRGRPRKMITWTHVSDIGKVGG